MKKGIDDTKVELTEKTKKETVNKIKEIISCLAFFKQFVEVDGVTITDVGTYMGLTEGYFKELTKLIGYDSVLVEEYNERFKEIKEKNIEIEQLKSERGKEVTPNAITGAIRRYKDILEDWYENEGFHYASISNMHATGITFELTSDMDYSHDTDKPDDILWDKNVGTEQKIAAGWDIYQSKYNAEMLDTDNNRERIKNLFQSCFPNYRVYSFSSRRNDYGSFSLRTEIAVTYADLENYYNGMLEKTKTEE